MTGEIDQWSVRQVLGDLRFILVFDCFHRLHWWTPYPFVCDPFHNREKSYRSVSHKSIIERLSNTRNGFAYEAASTSALIFILR